MAELEKLLVRIGNARDAISRKEEQTGLDYMIDGVLMNCSVMLKEQDQIIKSHKADLQETLDVLADYAEQQPKVGHLKRTGRKNVYGGIEIVCSVCDNHVMVQNMDDELFCRHCGAEMSETFNPVADT